MSMLTMQDIATLARVSRPAVSQWRKRTTVRGEVMPFPAVVERVDGVDRFLLRKIEKSTSERARHWKRDVSSAKAYAASVEPNRKRLAHILGVRDALATLPGVSAVVGNLDKQQLEPLVAAIAGVAFLIGVPLSRIRSFLARTPEIWAWRSAPSGSKDQERKVPWIFKDGD